MGKSMREVHECFKRKTLLKVRTLSTVAMAILASSHAVLAATQSAFPSFPVPSQIYTALGPIPTLQQQLAIWDCPADGTDDQQLLSIRIWASVQHWYHQKSSCILLSAAGFFLNEEYRLVSGHLCAKLECPAEWKLFAESAEQSDSLVRGIFGLRVLVRTQAGRSMDGCYRRSGCQSLDQRRINRKSRRPRPGLYSKRSW